MRCVNTTPLCCPPHWESKAARARQEAGADLAEIKKRSSVWRELKDPLADLSYDKCWYCEIRQERSDNAVDHFRPKSIYPWLAFQKSNLRYSCTYCNSGRTNPESGEIEGKDDNFPLLDETMRASAAGQEDQESPMLLDPAKTQDPGFLDFYEDGRPCARHPEHGVRKRRAETSIRTYHLDHPDIVEKRRVLAANIAAKIRQADALFPQCDTGNPAIDEAFSGLIRILSDAMSETAELSSFARKMIAGARDKVWVEQLLVTA